jgi:predicted GH43/DUF377 family glycosyl hydrolase
MIDQSKVMRSPVRRLKPTPIVEAGSVDGYGAIFNAGLAYVEGRFHLFARGVRAGYRRNPGSGACSRPLTPTTSLITLSPGPASCRPAVALRGSAATS